MEEIKIALFSQYTPTICSRLDHLAYMAPKNENNEDTKWILKKIEFSIQGNNIGTSSFKIKICKSSPSHMYINQFKELGYSKQFIVYQKKKHLIEECDCHFVVKTGEYIIPAITKISSKSYGWSLFLTFEEHEIINNCCVKANYSSSMIPFRKNIVENIIIVDDL